MKRVFYFFADSYSKSVHGGTAMHSGAVLGDIDKVREVYEKRPTDINRVNDHEFTPLDDAFNQLEKQDTFDGIVKYLEIVCFLRKNGGLLGEEVKTRLQGKLVNITVVQETTNIDLPMIFKSNPNDIGNALEIFSITSIDQVNIHELNKKYKQMCLILHPDVWARHNLPQSPAECATEIFKIISVAHKTILEHCKNINTHKKDTENPDNTRKLLN